MYRVQSIYKAGRVDSLSIILYSPWVKQVQVCEFTNSKVKFSEEIESNENTMVGDYINTMKTTFLFEF